jgi:hypothetical protein
MKRPVRDKTRIARPKKSTAYLPNLPAQVYISRYENKLDISS